MKKKAAFNEESGLFDIWFPLVDSFWNISKNIKEIIMLKKSQKQYLHLT